MPKFTFICDHSYDLDTHVVRHEFSADQLYDVVEQFEMFLKGAGYSFKGNVDIVDYNENTKHSPHYFDKDRNR